MALLLGRLDLIQAEVKENRCMSMFYHALAPPAGSFSTTSKRSTRATRIIRSAFTHHG